MTRQNLTRRANAKINLSLDLTGVLPDGYHAICTVMQSVTLCDRVTLRGGKAGIRLFCDDPAVPTDRRNTAYAAAEAFYTAAGRAPAVEIAIEKHIPSQAGLGGGSADAAAVLLGLNELHGFCLPQTTLLALALGVGADVPFCLLGGTRLCMNKGEVMAPLPPFAAHVVIAKPATGVSTAAAFQKFDSAPVLSHPRNDDVLFHCAKGAYPAALACAGNLFEQLCDVPEGAAIKRTLREYGACYAAMSGSGSAYFGLFTSAEEARRAAAALQSSVPFISVCETAGPTPAQAEEEG